MALPLSLTFKALNEHCHDYAFVFIEGCHVYQYRGPLGPDTGTLQPGDFVIMQLGHNDSGPFDDTARARGTIKGTGEDSSAIYNPICKVNEVVHTYGWYMRKYINDANAKGAVPIVCSPVPRNIFKNGKTERSNTGYDKWDLYAIQTEPSRGNLEWIYKG